MKSIHILPVVLAGLTAPVFAQETVPVPVEVPPVSLVGTETPIPEGLAYTGLEEVNAAAEDANRPKVPAAATNLAAGRPVTTSEGLAGPDYLSYEENGETKFLLTDGLKDSAEFNEMILTGEKQWVQIDLGAPQSISAVWVAHSHKAKRVFFDVVVQISNDPTFAEGVTTIYNNDADNTLGFGAGTDSIYLDTNNGLFVGTGDAPVTGQYVRFYSSGNSFEADKNFYIEAEVWGVPAA